MAIYQNNSCIDGGMVCCREGGFENENLTGICKIILHLIFLLRKREPHSVSGEWTCAVIGVHLLRFLRYTIVEN